MKSFIRHRRGGMTAGMTPLIDIMFMLLLFFLLTSSFMLPSISLTLPGAANRERTDDEPVIVSIDRDRRIFLGGDVIVIENLESLLRARMKDSEKKRVLFRGDENIPYRDFVNIIDIIKRSGAREIGIAHDRKK